MKGPNKPRLIDVRTPQEWEMAKIPGAELITDEPGHSPVAWQGSQLSRVIASVAARAAI
jgi:rhodanese-related sulfurtransferase